jgi:putative protein kinase ArgK-like GTPase of G3E family
VAAIERFGEARGSRFQARRRVRAGLRVRDLVARRLLEHLERDVLQPGEFEALLDRIAAREIDPHAAAATITARMLGTS